LNLATKQTLIRPKETLSIRDQADILQFNRSNYYYDNRPEFTKEESDILNRMDEIYTKDPCYGYRRQYHQLKAEGYQIGTDRVRNYMKVLNLKTIYPKAKHTSQSNKDHEKFPYLLKNMDINCPNMVWALDITYIRLKAGFCYLVAIIDWFSRRILSWRLSNSLERSFCIEALKEALKLFPKAGIINSDQGSQFTSSDFTRVVIENDIKMSMDSVGRWADNIIIERWFRTLKYENIYIMDYPTMLLAKEGIRTFIHYYNTLRLHSSLSYKTPDQLYFGLN
jgi:putative transposase